MARLQQAFARLTTAGSAPPWPMMSRNLPDPRADDRGLDAAEVDRFERLASDWWEPNGTFRPLHQLAPARLTFIRDEIIRHFGLAPRGLKPFQGLKILDIGCGGGLVSEPLARLGGRVTGIDPGAETIAVARAHAEAQGLAIEYRVQTVEDVAATGEVFDAALCLEVVEHVPDVGGLLATCAQLVRPGGLLVLSTINRTLKSYALAIVAAEYILGWLPRGTHDWNRFVTPEELVHHLVRAGFAAPRLMGLVYDPVRDRWSLDPDTDVNYLASGAKPAT
jgi:2-polyprenyl-6-hydroxyphenyl methylase/3-demethylubiquinone-9 3-methyltransferase